MIVVVEPSESVLTVVVVSAESERWLTLELRFQMQCQRALSLY